MSNILRNRNTLVGLLSITGLGIAACGALDESGNDDWSDHIATLEASGKLDTEYLLGTVDGSVRHDPQRIESSADGDNNECFDANVEPFEVEVISSPVITTTDANSPWFGVPLENLPESVRAACIQDVDETVWVSSTAINQR